MTRVNSVWPLIRRQFRDLKWFLIAYMLVCGLLMLMFGTRFAAMVSSIWQGVALRQGYVQWWTLHSTMVDMGWFVLVPMAILTLVLAIFQQVDAYNQRNAQLMVSMPVTRGKGLAAQLVSGLSIIVSSIALFSIGAGIILGWNTKLLALASAISPAPDFTAALNAPGNLYFVMLRILMLLVSLYLFVSVLMGLFGNAGLNVGFVAAVAFLAFSALLMAPMILNNFYSLGWESPGIREMASYKLLIGIDGYARSESGSLWTMFPMHDLGAFLVIYALIIAISLLGLIWQRKHVQMEELGGAFLFKQSRWALVAYFTAWMLLIPLIGLTHYDQQLHKQVLNRYLPLLMIPAILVFCACRYFLITRPTKKLRIRTAATAIAVLLALTFVPQGASAAAVSSAVGSSDQNASGAKADAQDKFVTTRLDAAQMQFDTAHARRISDLITAIQANVDANFPDDDPNAWGYHYETNMDARLDSYGNPLKFDAYESISSSLIDNILSFYVGGSSISATQLDLVLRSAGFAELADGIFHGASDSGLTVQDGVWLVWRKHLYVMDEEQTSDSFSVQIYANTPYTVKRAQNIDELILKQPNIRRKNAFSNGQYDTVVYEMLNIWDSFNIHVILKDGKLHRLMLSYAMNDANTRREGEQCKQLFKDIEQATGQPGNWMQFQDNVLQKMYYVMVEFG